MRKIFVFLSISTILSSDSFSQVLTNNEIHGLHSTIAIFLTDRDKTNKIDTKRKSEFILCMLEVDSMGKIDNIHFFLDDKNKDATASYLNQLTPATFKNWKMEKCKGKTIMLPILSLAQDKSLEPEYIKGLSELYPIKRVGIVNETSKLIIIDALLYKTPYAEKENPQESEEVKKSKTDKQNRH